MCTRIAADDWAEILEDADQVDAYQTESEAPLVALAHLLSIVRRPDYQSAVVD